MKKIGIILLMSLMIFSVFGCTKEKMTEAEAIMVQVIEKLEKEPQISVSSRNAYVIVGEGEELAVNVDYIAFQKHFTDPDNFEMETRIDVNIGHQSKEIREWVRDGICYVYDYDIVEKKKWDGTDLLEAVKSLNRQTWKEFGKTAAVEKNEEGDYVISGSGIAMTGYVDMMMRFIIEETLHWNVIEDPVLENAEVTYVVSPEYRLKYALYDMDVQFETNGQKKNLEMNGGVAMQPYESGNYTITWPDFSDWNEDSLFNEFLIKNENDFIFSYAWYLERAEDQTELNVQVNELSENEYRITIENPSDLFYYGKIILDSDQKSSIPVLIRSDRTEFYDLPLAQAPAQAEFEIIGAYRYEFPVNNDEYKIENELDPQGKIQRNLIVPIQHNHPEDLIEMAKRIYAECMIANQKQEEYFVFYDGVEKTEKDGSFYYDPADANYRITIDLKKKRITLEEHRKNTFVEIRALDQ